jgi:hypothetical protein
MERDALAEDHCLDCGTVLDEENTHPSCRKYSIHRCIGCYRENIRKAVRKTRNITPSTGQIYIVQVRRLIIPIKLGRTTNPDQRLAQFRRFWPDCQMLVRFLSHDQAADEAILLREFEKHRVEGTKEQFNVHPLEALAVMRSMPQMEELYVADCLRPICLDEVAPGQVRHLMPDCFA